MDFLQPQTVARLGAKQYMYTQRFTIGAATGGNPSEQGSGSIGIQGGIHFFTESLFLVYPTTRGGDGGAIVDDGVTRLTLALSSGKSLPMQQNPISLAFMVPGRMPVANSVPSSGSGDVMPGQPPHIEGFPFKYFLAEGSSFQHQFSNTSDLPAEVFVCWRGWNIYKDRCPDEETFNRIVVECQLPPVVA